MERQLWWNFDASVDEERQIVRYFFVIVSDKRDTKIMINKLYNTFGPIEPVTKREGKIKRIPYTLISFDTYNKEPNNGYLQQVYKGKKKKDVRLTDRIRSGIDGLENYVRRQIEK